MQEANRNGWLPDPAQDPIDLWAAVINGSGNYKPVKAERVPSSHRPDQEPADAEDVFRMFGGGS